MFWKTGPPAATPPISTSIGHPQERKLHNRVLMPILGDHYGRLIDDRQIRLEREGGSFQVRYADHVFPLAPRTFDDILSKAADDHRRRSSWRLPPTWPAICPRPIASIAAASIAATAIRKFCGACSIRNCASTKIGPRQSIRSIDEINKSPDRIGLALGAAKLSPRLLAHRQARPRLSPILRHQHAWPRCASKTSACSPIRTP